MIKCILQRTYENDDLTLGMLNFQGFKHKPIYVLELPWRENLPLLSRIPATEYALMWHVSPKHGECYKVMDVKNRTDILIHIGNYPDDTLGCLLPGTSGLTRCVQHSSSAMEIIRGILGKEVAKLVIYDPR